MFYGVFIAEEDDRAEDKGSGGTTVVDIETVLVALLNMPLGPTHFSDEALLWYKAELPV